MPWSDAQRRLFHAADEDEDVAREHGMSHEEAGKLADEADDYARQGKEKKVKGFIDLEPIFNS